MIEDPIIAKESFFNALELGCAFSILFIIFLFQMISFESPCTLCLLQRIGFIGITFGFVMNLRFGLHPSHYVISLLSGVFASLVALRQIALHTVPGTDSNGGVILWLHLYTWSFIVALLSIIINALILGANRSLEVSVANKRRIKSMHVLFGMMTILVLANILSIVYDCGFSLICPDFSVLDFVWY